MKKAVFLDRDGTVNEEVNYLFRCEDLHILPGVAEGIHALRNAGFKIFVVTNQAGIARGYYGIPDMEKLHLYLNKELEKENAHIDAFYFCPHHPEHGIGEYKKICHCRKPEIGMFEKAEAEWGEIDRAHSYMIGDKAIDSLAGKRFGLTGILLGTGYGEKEKIQREKYDVYAENFMKAVEYILQKEK